MASVLSKIKPQESTFRVLQGQLNVMYGFFFFFLLHFLGGPMT